MNKMNAEKDFDEYVNENSEIDSFQEMDDNLCPIYDHSNQKN